MEQHELLSIVTAIVFEGDIKSASRIARQIIDTSKSKEEEPEEQEPPAYFTTLNSKGSM